MARIPLGVGAYSRPYGRLPEIRMENRFFEQNPLGAEQTALLSRPGTKLMLNVGEGPIRLLYSQAGVFEHDLFVVSGPSLYRYSGEGDPLKIDGTVAGSGYPVMTSVSIPGWQAVFITDGVKLQYYEGESHASSELTALGDVEEGDEVSIGQFNYIFTDENLDEGSPDGSLDKPWKVKLGLDAEQSLQNLFSAIMGTGIPGAIHSSHLVPHPQVRVRSMTEDSFEAVALVGGEDGNGIPVSATGLLSWSSGVLEGGGGHTLKLCRVPDNLPVSDLVTLASFVVAAIGGSQKFYWLPPGEIHIKALDFSSAESEPDEIVNLAVAGDNLWIFGQSSTESWYVTGELDQPFRRSQGRVFSQGIIPGTFARLGDDIVVVGQDMVAYRITGQPERISHHGIEEIFRRWQEIENGA